MLQIIRSVPGMGRRIGRVEMFGVGAEICPKVLVRHCCPLSGKADIDDPPLSTKLDPLNRDKSSSGSNNNNKNNNSSSETKIDRSRLPVLDEADLTEVFISGSGPGGQSVNKAVNCCQIKHKPTGIVVKVHQTRSLETNRAIARELMVQKLDNLYNGDNSIQAQKHRQALRKISIRESQAEQRRLMKERYKNKLVDQNVDNPRHEIGA